MHLIAIIDRFSRYAVGRRLVDDMGAANVADLMLRAFDEHGGPAMANSGQGGALTSREYGRLHESRRVVQSMGGEAGWVDNDRALQPSKMYLRTAAGPVKKL